MSDAEALAAAEEAGARYVRSPAERVPRVTGAGAPSPETWFEDACSLVEKQRLATAHGLRGIALWHLGKEDPALFPALAQDRCPE